VSTTLKTTTKNHNALLTETLNTPRHNKLIMEVHIVSQYGSGTDSNVTLVEETSVGDIIRVHYEDGQTAEYSRASITEATSSTGMSVTIVSQYGSGTDENVKKIEELEPNLYRVEYFDDTPTEYSDASITKIIEE